MTATSAHRERAEIRLAFRESVVHSVPWYPVVLAVAFVLNLFLESGISPFAVLRSLTVAVGFAALLTAVSAGMVRDRHRGAAIAGLIVLVMAGWRQPILLGVAAVLLLAVLVILPRTRWSMSLTWPAVTRILNVVSLMLLVGIGVKVVQAGAVGTMAADIHQGRPLVAATSRVPPNAPPDIYMILLDGHPRGDTIGKVFGGDPSAFEAALAAQGFDIIERSYANYNFTALTLASVLDMRLLDEIDAVRLHLGTQDRDQPLLRNVINHSAALALLRERGYEIATTASGFEGVTLRQADVYLDSGELNEFETTLIRATPIGWLLDRLGVDVLGDQLRSRVRHAFEFLHQLAVTPSSRPRFAFVHLTTPHAPLIFGTDGKPVATTFDDPFAFPDRPAHERAAFIEAYRGGVEYLDGLVVDAIDDLLASAPPGRDPIIVLFSDHGPRTGLGGSAQEQRTEQLANFLAVRAPGRANLFEEDATLVNVLPTLFDAYLGTQLPRSPDRSHLTRGDHLFELAEVPGPDADPEP